MKIAGKAIIFGDNINTDLIIPGRYLTITNPEELAKHAMEPINPNFPEKAGKGVIIIAGRNFGCGSSREQAPIALKHAGVKCIIAENFAGIFYRNAVNIGLPVIESKEAKMKIKEGDLIQVNLNEGLIINKTKKQAIHINKLPRFILEIIEDGGLINHIKRKWRKMSEV